MNTIILSAASIEAIRTYTDVSIEATGAKESAAAALISQGVTADMLKAPAKGESRELYDGVKAAIVSGFSEEARALLLAKISELTEEQIYGRRGRRYWQQQIGSKLRDLRDQMTPKKGRDPARSKVAIVQEAYDELLVKLSKLDPETDQLPDVMDIPAASNLLKQSLAAFIGKGAKKA
tara:strand:- start:352 stop:885 length:534 start_codon:yes stop_codon:yes gene_type:complete